MRGFAASLSVVSVLSLLVSGGVAGGCGGSSPASGPDEAPGTDRAGSSAGEDGGSSTGATGTGGDGAGVAAGATGSPVGGESGSTQGGVDGDGAGGETGACKPAQIMFVVSRSGAMFLGVPAAWGSVRAAALAALEKVDARAELGFLAVTGEADACPTLTEVAPAPSNYAQIEDLYGSLASPIKGESPFMYGLDRAGELLTGAGKKHIVFVLNGEADYCSDGLPACPTDSVIAHIQKLHQAGIGTSIASAPALLAMGDERSAAYEAALDGYANAGAGLPTKSHDGPTLLNQMCSSASDAGAMAWREELEASGKPATATLADYSETGGDAAHVDLDPSDLGAMTDALTDLLDSIATCD